jgi:hypothetical protein
MEPEGEPALCLDCGAPLAGPYCSACGQKGGEKILPLGHLLHEVFHELWHVDSRFLRSAWALLKPGFLTQEYIAGRRTRWFPPFRLYLIASLMLFLLISVLPSKAAQFKITVGPPVNGKVVDAPAGPPAQAGEGSRLARKAEAINRNPAPFLAKLLAWLPRVLFLLLPLFALLLKAAYLRTRTLYAVHAIFSLHEHTFVFFLLMVVKLVGAIPHAGLLGLLLLLALPLHLLLALKRVYGQRWPITLLKAFALGLAHAIATAGVLFGTTMFVLWMD